MRSSAQLTSRLLGRAVGMALLVALAGCGRSIPTEPTSAPPPPETGSNTLLVEAGIAGSDLPTGGFTTEFTARVRDGHGVAVSDATVLLYTPGGMVQLIEQPGAAGTYHCSTGEYVPGTYSLTVYSGSDRVSGVRVVAPDVHQILSPAAYDTVVAGSDLEIDWSRSAPTQEVVVETLDYNGAVGEDAGATTIPSSGDPPRTDQRIRVIRSNLATMSGGLPGSRLTASIRNSVEPVIAQ
jgi:hypothetical protein